MPKHETDSLLRFVILMGPDWEWRGRCSRSKVNIELSGDKKSRNVSIGSYSNSRGGRNREAEKVLQLCRNVINVTDSKFNGNRNDAITEPKGRRTYCRRCTRSPSHRRAGPAAQPCTDDISVKDNNNVDINYNNNKRADCLGEIVKTAKGRKPRCH